MVSHRSSRLFPGLYAKFESKCSCDGERSFTNDAHCYRPGNDNERGQAGEALVWFPANPVVKFVNAFGKLPGTIPIFRSATERFDQTLQDTMGLGLPRFVGQFTQYGNFAFPKLGRHGLPRDWDMDSGYKNTIGTAERLHCATCPNGRLRPSWGSTSGNLLAGNRPLSGGG